MRIKNKNGLALAIVVLAIVGCGKRQPPHFGSSKSNNPSRNSANPEAALSVAQPCDSSFQLKDRSHEAYSVDELKQYLGGGFHLKKILIHQSVTNNENALTRSVNDVLTLGKQPFLSDLWDHCFHSAEKDAAHLEESQFSIDVPAGFHLPSGSIRLVDDGQFGSRDSLNIPAMETVALDAGRLRVKIPAQNEAFEEESYLSQWLSVQASRNPKIYILDGSRILVRLVWSQPNQSISLGLIYEAQAAEEVVPSANPPAPRR